jgi:Rrf2 family protein
MQIALGRRGDYAVRAMLCLSRSYGQGRRKAREIALEMGIPERFLPQILAPFVREGLLVAVAGPDGGYELARPPAEVTLLEVVETAEGQTTSDHCTMRGGPCDWRNACAMHEPWKRAQSALAAELQRTNFADLAREDAALERRNPRAARAAASIPSSASANGTTAPGATKRRAPRGTRTEA